MLSNLFIVSKQDSLMECSSPSRGVVLSSFNGVICPSGVLDHVLWRTVRKWQTVRCRFLLLVALSRRCAPRWQSYPDRPAGTCQGADRPRWAERHPLREHPRHLLSHDEVQPSRPRVYPRHAARQSPRQDQKEFRGAKRATEGRSFPLLSWRYPGRQFL